MFIGHFALGFAAKRAVPRANLAVLFGAAQLADLLWPVFVALGIEQVRIVPGITRSTPLDFVSYPYSHSLIALIVWGLVFGWIAARVVPGRGVFVAMFALVISHWVLDVLVHRPDMPVYPGAGPRFGLGLWNFPVPEKILEILMFAAGLWIYARTTRARDLAGKWGVWSVAAFLFLGYLASSAPPPSVTALWATAILLGGLTMVWTWWGDRHREPFEDWRMGEWENGKMGKWEHRNID